MFFKLLKDIMIYIIYKHLNTSSKQLILDPNPTNDQCRLYQTPLHKAAHFGYLSVFKFNIVTEENNGKIPSMLFNLT